MHRASLVAQRVKHLPTMQETWVQSLGQEDHPEKEMATHYSTLAWKIPWMAKPNRLQSMGSQSQTWLSDFTFFLIHSYYSEKNVLNEQRINMLKGKLKLSITFVLSCSTKIIFWILLVFIPINSYSPQGQRKFL